MELGQETSECQLYSSSAGQSMEQRFNHDHAYWFYWLLRGDVASSHLRFMEVYHNPTTPFFSRSTLPGYRGTTAT